MTLTEFLLARIAEDEAHVAAHRTVVFDNPWTAREVPGRAAAEVAAKRRIFGLAGGFDPYSQDTALLVILASVYADHPDYQQEWTRGDTR